MGLIKVYVFSCKAVNNFKQLRDIDWSRERRTKYTAQVLRYKS